jgi:hypothetical protein
MKRKRKGLRIAVLSVACLLTAVLGGFYVYTLDYYHADADALGLLSSDPLITQEDGNITLIRAAPISDMHVGLIFYPGGKVEASAYLPLLKQLSQKGITCVLLKMPFNLAVFDVNAADRVYTRFPEIQSWYLAGHSLGGAMASSYAGAHTDQLKGLILLGAYPLNDAAVATLAVYGSEDQGLDRAKLESAEEKVEISGGNHAYFGNYGEQKGDGTATITREAQQAQAVDAIITFIQTTNVEP